MDAQARLKKRGGAVRLVSGNDIPLSLRVSGSFPEKGARVETQGLQSSQRRQARVSSRERMRLRALAGAGEGKTDRGRSQLLRLRTMSSCLEGRAISLQGIHLALRLPPVWGLPHYPNSLMRCSPECRPLLPLVYSPDSVMNTRILECLSPMNTTQVFDKLCIDWLTILLTGSTQTCPTGSVLGVAIGAAYRTQHHQLLKNAANSFCFCFFEINNMSLRPRHGKQWRLFSVSKGWTCLWLPLQ